MALERADTVNDYVRRAIRWGSDGTNEVCPSVPDFTPCVQNEIFGNPVGTIQLTCRDLPRIREAFPPEGIPGDGAKAVRTPMTIDGLALE